MPVFANSRKQYDNLLSQRAKHLAAAEAAKNAGNTSEYQTFLNKAKELNPQIDELKMEVEEAERYANLHAPKFGQSRQDIEEMGKALLAKERVKVDVAGAFRSLRQDSVLLTGSIATPTGAGTQIHDELLSASSLADQVQAVTLTGLNSWEEPYVVSDPEAIGADPATVSGQARTATDPVFAKARMRSYEASVTSFVDRNISRLSPADYAAKIQAMALRGLRRKVNSLIVSGDGQESPSMFGITNAKNTNGNNIFAVSAAKTIDPSILTTMVMEYGGDEFVGGNARLLLSKANLIALGALRGTNEKKRLFNITPDAGSPSTGVIEDGGLIVPYTLVSGIGDKTLAYGDPFNYMMPLFGDYTIRVDSSVKAVERMDAILGDVLVGGNLVVDKGFVVATLTA